MISFTISLSAAALALLPAFTSSFLVGPALLAVWALSLFMNGPALQTYFIQQAPQSANSTVFYHPWIACGAVVLGLVMGCVSFSLRVAKDARLKAQEPQR